MMRSAIIAGCVLALSASVVEARTVKVCSTDLKRCVTVKLPTRGCKSIMGYKICR